MNLAGLALCSRFSYPPNSLSLCGPDRQNDLSWYAETQKTDMGTSEILSRFSTLYPYLEFITRENRLSDPFLPQVVEAYWLGNRLLQNISARHFALHLKDKMSLRKILKPAKLNAVLGKLDYSSIPHHAFHVLNIYKRTGHLLSQHTIQTMDACIINWGKVKKVNKNSVDVKTSPLSLSNGKLIFGQKVIRTLIPQGDKDVLFNKLAINDWVSYHWGYFCRKLTKRQLNNLIYYTTLSIMLANIK